jgi:undecaprenyl diphosphate synthase
MHVAIIMDGNGRWAEQRGLPRTEGHRAGARAVRRVVEAAARSSIERLTLYAFSCDNWERPADEVDNLMLLLRRHLIGQVARCVNNGVRVVFIGRRDRLSPDLVRAIEHAERLTAAGTRMTLQVAVDYSARAAIIGAAQAAPADASRAEFSRLVGEACHAAPGDVDLLIRTGGERRLSDFLLWESAYAELVFVDTYWPDFDEHGLAAALAEFRARERRFGGLPAEPRTAGAQAARDDRASDCRAD